MTFYRTQISIMVLLILAVPSLQLNWQGTGTMNSTVMGQINTLIASNPITNSTGANDVDTVAQTISTSLNALWDPAWNVVIVKQSVGYDSVLYGYAYNNHWMWINGIPVSGDSTKIWAYIIWKDYNCQNWGLINTIAGQTTFTSDFQMSMFDILQFWDPLDPWDYAYRFVKTLESYVNGSAYSAIVSQDGLASINGCICLVNKNVKTINQIVKRQDVWVGSYLVFQTRKLPTLS